MGCRRTDRRPAETGKNVLPGVPVFTLVTLITPGSLHGRADRGRRPGDGAVPRLLAAAGAAAGGSSLARQGGPLRGCAADAAGGPPGGRSLPELEPAAAGRLATD